MSPWFRRIWRFESGRGADVGTFGLGSYYFFFPPLPGTNPLDYQFSRGVGALLLAAFAAQVAGAWLKRPALQARAAAAPATPGEDRGAKIFFFMLMHPIVFGMLFFAGAASAFPGLARRVEQSEGSVWVPVVMILGAALSTLPTIAVAWALSARRDVEQLPAWRRSEWAELIADQLLLFSFFVIFATIFGLPAMMTGIRSPADDSPLERILLVVIAGPLLWLCFCFLWVPSRILLIAEEIGTWRNRLASISAVLPLAARYFVG
jgi:hypothetical protein